MSNVFYEGMREITHNGETIYCGWPSKKEDFFKVYNAHIEEDGITVESRTDVEEVIDRILPKYQTSDTRTFITKLCKKEKQLGTMSFLWYAITLVKEIEAERDELWRKGIHQPDRETYEGQALERSSRKIRHDELSHQLDLIFIHDAGRAF